MGLFNKKRIEQPIQPVSKPVNQIKENTSMVLSEQPSEKVAIKQKPEVEMYEDEETAEVPTKETEVEEEYSEDENDKVPAMNESNPEYMENISEEFDEEALQTELRTIISQLETTDARLTKIESFLFRNMR